MLAIIMAFTLGILLSGFRLLPGFLYRFLDPLLLGTVALLLFGMGLNIGMSPEILGNLPRLGGIALVISAAAILGSVVFIWRFGRYFFGDLHLHLEAGGAAGGMEEGSIEEEVHIEKESMGNRPIGDSPLLGETSEGRTTPGPAPHRPKGDCPQLGDPMLFSIVGAVLAGILAGYLLAPAGTSAPDVSAPAALLFSNLDNVNTTVLWALVFIVGVDLGRNKHTWLKIKEMGIKVLWAPALVTLGTLTGAALAALLLPGDLRLSEVLAISAGFGWYSMSAVLLKTLAGTEIGTIAFLANLFREMLAIIFMPAIVRIFGRASAMAPGGATSMDTTLPFVSRYGGKDIALIGFISGLALTIVSPFLIPLLIGWNI